MKKEILLGEETDSIMEHKELLKRTEWFVFLPTVFEARVRAGLREMLDEAYPGQFTVKKDCRSLKLFPKHSAAPDVVVYRKGEEDGTPIAIYDCKLYRNSKASKNSMHQVESQIAAFSSPSLSPHRYGLVYGHFTSNDPVEEDHVYHIDLRGDKADADVSFQEVIKRLSEEVAVAADERRRQLRLRPCRR